MRRVPMPPMESWEVNEHQTVHNVHPEATCIGGSCTIHRQSDHHMRSWPLWWRDDRAMFERVCPHGIGHPDPDGVDFLGGGVHGCDGCCAAPSNDDRSTDA